MADVTAAESLLLETLGPLFLTYILNVDETSLKRRLDGRSSLPPQQEDVLSALIAFLGSVPRAQSSDRFSLSLSLSALAEFRPDLGMSWASGARVMAGGAIDLPRRRDKLGRALLELARDAYPLFLLPPPTEDQFRFMAGPPISAQLYSHPDRSTFDEAVMADKTLAALFPGDDKHSGRHGSLFDSTGVGGGIQLSMFADTILRAAWEYALHKDANPSLERFAEQALELLSFARAAIQGRKRLKIPALMGVTGVRLPQDSLLELPWGRLREVDDRDRRLIPPGLGGQLSHTARDGTQVVVDYAGDLVMELEVPYHVHLGARREEESWPTSLGSQEALERRLESLRLALPLCTSGETTPTVLGTWQYFLDPLSQTYGSSWRDPRRAPSFTPVALTKSDAKQSVEWTRLVDAKRTKSVDIAVRRTLQAAAERADPTDALVDAVIAWENLVGSSEGEPTLRISAALSWLLGEHSDERDDIRKRIAQLYGLRSKVVHGARVLRPEESVEKRQEALDITIRVMRTLFRDRPELLSECPNSTARSARLIVGG